MTGCILDRQQLDQRALRRMVGQQGKIPGDAVVELLLAQGGLQVDLRVYLCFFMSPRWLDALKGQRAADAKVGEQHLALLVKDGLAVLEQGQGDVFQRQTHHLFAVRVMADKADQTGHRLHKGVPGLPGQLVAVTGGAGGGVAHAAGGHQHGIRPVFPAGSAPHADAAQGRARPFSFWGGAGFPARRGGSSSGGSSSSSSFFAPS